MKMQICRNTVKKCTWKQPVKCKLWYRQVYKKML